MAVDIAHDIWQELKRYISSVDRHEAAEILVNLLVDNDYNVEDIKDAFKGDNDIKHALQSFTDDIEEDLDEEDEDDYEDEY